MGESHLVEMIDNRWRVLEPTDMPAIERDLLADLLGDIGLHGQPWAGGFPAETGYVDGVLSAFPGSTVVTIDPPYEFEEGVVY